MAKVQKNFYVEDDFRDCFNSWCLQNGYDGGAVFLAATMLFSQLSVSERADVFAETQVWLEKKYPSLVGDGSLKLAAKRPARQRGLRPTKLTP